MNQLISLVIPTLNDATLPRTLDSVIAQSRAADEIIVVGKDEAGVCDRFPQVRFIDTGHPVCAAAARNRGIAAASGSILAFTDSDCIPATDWLAQHENAHSRGEKVVGGGVFLAGSSYWAQSDNVSMFHEFVSFREPAYRPYLPTLNISVHRSVIEKTGGMDESLPTAEDMDWSIRIRLAGFKLYFEPGAEVKHAPTRNAWSDISRHWHRTGHNAIRVRHRYPEEFRTPRFAARASALRAMSPLLALYATARVYSSKALWRFLHYLPVVYATKVIYCFGAAKAIDSGYAFSRVTKLPVLR